jgi:cystathionine beta-lyase
MRFFNPQKHREDTDFVKNHETGYGHLYKSEDVFPFWIADMDFKVALPIQEEIKRIGERGVFAYEYNNSKLYGSICRWYQERHQINLKIDAFVQVNGVLTGIALLTRLFSNAKEGVIISTPVYHMFSYMIRSNGRRAIENKMHQGEDGKFKIDFDDLEEKMASKNNTLYLLCNPHNPVGRVWTKDELMKVKELAHKYGVRVISDEVHADILFGSSKFNSYMEIDPEEGICLLGSPAKTFGLQSVATGHIYTENQSLLRMIKKEAEALFIHHGNALTYYITRAAYDKGSPWLDEFIDYLEETNRVIFSFCTRYLPELKIVQPEGTYQLWMNFKGFGFENNVLHDWIFNKAKMGLAPGEQFAKDYQGWYRLNTATDRDVILTHLQRLFESKPVN